MQNLQQGALLAEKYNENLKALKSQNVEPVYLFMTGGSGSRKSDLIKTIYYTVVQTYRHAPTNPEKPTALLAISIGVAAINIHLMI